MASETFGYSLRRVRNVLRDERPEVIEVEVVPAAGGVLVVRGGDLDGVVARRHVAADLQICRRAAVLVEVEIVRGGHAVHGDADLAAVGVEERPEVEVVHRRLRIGERDLPDVAAVGWRGARRVARAPPLRRPAGRAVLVVLPKAGVLAPRVGLLDPRRRAADLEAGVAGDSDVRDGRAPLHVGREPAPGRELLHARASQPGPRRRALVPTLDGDLSWDRRHQQQRAPRWRRPR